MGCFHKPSEDRIEESPFKVIWAFLTLKLPNTLPNEFSKIHAEFMLPNADQQDYI